MMETLVVKDLNLELPKGEFPTIWTFRFWQNLLSDDACRI